MRCPGLLVFAAALLLVPVCKAQDKEEPASPKEKNGTSAARGWLNWRGPLQTGVSLEKNLPAEWVLNGKNHLWTCDLAGRGAPVIANGKVYAFGYKGEGQELQERLVCLDAETGKLEWERRFSDFLSDIIYDRYTIGSPIVDAETGNVYVMTAAGIFACFTADGKPVFEISLAEDFGRLTFPNGRTGGPFIDGEQVIAHGITSNWGGQGPAGHRFYSFEKKSGRPIWAGGTGLRPSDSCFSTPFLAWQGGKRVFYTGTGDGHVACFNARTGQCLWRYRVTLGGVNSSVVAQDGLLVATHNQENVDSSEIGRIFALKLDAVAAPDPAAPKTPPVLPKSAEVWRRSMGALSSSPVVHEGVVYQTVESGELYALELKTGKDLWSLKLGIEQQHASPLYADGKLYVPIKSGEFFIVEASAKEGKKLCEVKLDGECVGAPAAWNGKVYVFSTEKLYCFGTKGDNPGLPAPVAEAAPPAAGPPVALQIIPNEMNLRPAQKQAFTIRAIDANGLVAGIEKQAEWAKYIPPEAKVISYLNAGVDASGELVTEDKPVPSAGAFQAKTGELAGTIRGRVLPGVPLKQDFEQFEIKEAHASEEGVKFAYPPLPWVGARFKWDIRDLDGNKVLTKTIDNKLFQRAFSYISHSDLSNYTIEAEVMSDGNKRKMSEVGLLNQRYCIVLKGNAQEIEVNSNLERLREAVPFKWTPKTWYHLKTRVDLDPAKPATAGVVRAKAWKKGDPEPEAWTIEVKVVNPHQHGAPGIYGFSPQDMRVYVDNVSVTSNK